MLATSPRGPPSWSLQVLLNVSLVDGLMIECMVLVARDVQAAGPPHFSPVQVLMEASVGTHWIWKLPRCSSDGALTRAQ